MKMKNLFRRFDKKIIISFFSIMLIALSVTGCGSTQKAAIKSPSVKDILEKVKQATDVSEMRDGDETKLKKLYGINKDEVEEFVLLTAPSNIKADELLIIKVKDANSINGIKEKISSRIEKQSSSFKDYLPDEYYIIQKNIVKTKDNYVIFAVSKNVDKIASTFEESFK